ADPPDLPAGQTLAEDFANPATRGLIAAWFMRALARAPELVRPRRPALWRTKLTRRDLFQVVADVVNEWIDLGGVRPWLLPTRYDIRTDTGDDPLKIVIAPDFRNLLAPHFPLFGALALQLMY